jgi:hypothetical protein
MTNIVLTVRGRYRLTEQAFRSLLDHTSPDQFNLTIVHDASGDLNFKVGRLVEAAAGWPNITALSVLNSNHKLSSLKRLGIEWSCARFGSDGWLCTVDSDVYFGNDWLSTMVTAAELTRGLGFKLWGGQQHPYHHAIAVVGGTQTPETYLEEYEALPGTHWFMPWSTWWEFGNSFVSSAPGVCQGEDVSFCQAIRNHDGRIGVVKPFCVADCGLTNTEGKPQPGAELRTERWLGVLYE